MAKRIFDILFSFLGLLIILLPGFIIALLVVLGSGWGPFYRQQRVGRHGKEFGLFKFRTMHRNSDRKGLLTIGSRDPRVTRMGYFLRKTKMDELPQLLNIFIGDMSFVGPRPEVKKYVDLYNDEQRKVLTVRPGLTDFASLQYINESELLAKSDDPEKTYIEEVMPAKLLLNLHYINKMGFATDISIMLNTLFAIVGLNRKQKH